MTPEEPDPVLAGKWFAAATDAAVVGELEAIYTSCADQVEARGPACWASGRCCNFKATGHLLYVTGLEAAYTAARLPGGAPSAAELEQALASGGCPLQQANLCGAHAIRPLGCRVYFCDRSAQQWQQELYERLLAMLRALHDRHAIPYRYGEWRAMLAMVRPLTDNPPRTPQ